LRKSNLSLEVAVAKEKIVRCMISKDHSDGHEKSVRYIPLEIFELWKIVMTERHDFAIEEDCISRWFDIDGDPNVTYADANYDKVVRLSLSLYSEQDGMFKTVTRYFPSNSYHEIKPRFLSHYTQYLNASRFPPGMNETYGVWLKPIDR
jgi:hypothetical protein